VDRSAIHAAVAGASEFGKQRPQQSLAAVCYAMCSRREPLQKIITTHVHSLKL